MKTTRTTRVLCAALFTAAFGLTAAFAPNEAQAAGYLPAFRAARTPVLPIRPFAPLRAATPVAPYAPYAPAAPVAPAAPAAPVAPAAPALAPMAPMAPAAPMTPTQNYYYRNQTRLGKAIQKALIRNDRRLYNNGTYRRAW